MSRSLTIKRKGKTATLWEIFRNKYAEECRGADGLIECQCDDNCGIRTVSPDLTHIVSKVQAPALYFVKTNLRWQIRAHHMKEHMKEKPND